MEFNVGMIDRIIRFVLGVFLVAAPFVFTASFWGIAVVMYASVLVGAVLMITSVVGLCPLYSLFGISTRRLS